ncbi:flagellar hook protein [Buchnera aphidicola (Aphis helianthi)]|uniref:Flagellar hook-associated protein 1 n=1 Tax=Buchnera aphidicola (Aphis helianthi) TaxID=2315802 RepID=A0A4D6XQA7_9GAMM|nr:flagellar hook protein [Buchnera aphidicola]QCI17164.1 flagellar hook protein [Buchnera aphidicola (Aphis helianthi)]
MSSILTSTISSIDAIKILIDNTSEKVLNPNHRNSSERIAIENNIDDSNANAGLKIQRVYDEYNDFIEEEKRKTSERVQDEQTRIEEYLKLENLFIEKIHIFNDLMNTLYSSIQENIVNKNQNVFNEEIEKNLKNIVNGLKNFNEKLTFLEKDVKNIILEKIKKANILINKIYNLNIDIRYFPVKQVPNGIYKYIDQRDQLVNELNDIIGVTVVKDHNNFEVRLHNGMCLINDDKKQNLMVLTSETDDKYISVAYWDNNEKKLKKMEHMIPSGSLGALFSFRREELQNAKNKLGQLTINFADSINENHTLGYDILGNLGKQVFNISTPEIISSSNNISNPFTSIKWISTSDAQDTNYIVSMQNNHWIVKRLRDQTICEELEVYKNSNNTYLTFDGMELKIEGNNNEGNMYMIKPYSKTLDELELLIVENSPFAFSSTNDISQQNKNNAIIIHNLNKDKLVNKKDTLGTSYLKFLKSISYKCNDLEEKVPFKRQMIEILKKKKLSVSDDINEDYQKLSYEQKCYIANVKILKMAESIFNDIVDCYS